MRSERSTSTLRGAYRGWVVGVERIVSHIGWHDTSAGQVFVLPDGAIGAGDTGRVMLQSERSGTLKECQHEVAAGGAYGQPGKAAGGRSAMVIAATSEHAALRLIEAAHAVCPTILNLYDETKRTDRLPATLVESLRDSGLSSLWLARSFGAPKLSLADFTLVIEVLARADGSVAWCVSVAAAFSRFSGCLPDGHRRGAARHRAGSTRRPP
jgi:hypothetical protein